MPRRPRILAALPFVVLLVGLPACSLDVQYEGSHFACDDGRCPTGYECRATLCEPRSSMFEVDADTEAPDADVADAAPAAADAAVDATPAPPDAALPDAALPCTGTRVVQDPATGHCYIRVQPSMTWANANTACGQLGGNTHLATISSTTEQNLVASLDDGTIQDAWIGATDAPVEGDWRWLDGKDFPPSPAPNALSFQKWNTGEPNNFNGNEDCSIMELTNGGVWDDRNCTSTLSSICERE